MQGVVWLFVAIEVTAYYYGIVWGQKLQAATFVGILYLLLDGTAQYCLCNYFNKVSGTAQ